MSFLVKAMTQAAAGAGGVEKDEYFNQTTLLLHGDGNQGANNFSNAGPPSYLAFSDNSSNDFPITVNGDAYGTPFSPYSLSDGYWSNYFGSVPSTSNDRLVPSSSASAIFGTGQFTIEAWVWTTTKDVSGANRTWLGNTGSSSQGQCYINTSGYVVFGNTGLFSLTGNTDVADGAWHHIAISRSGTGANQCALFVDGVRQAVGTNTVDYTTATLYIGINDGTNGDWIGYISNLRIVKGSYVYDPASSTVTVPTTPLTAITNTSLLTCQSNRFLDNSVNGYTFTVGGAPSVKTLNPFDATLDGTTGSGYFDGTGDYLSLTTKTVPSNFTISGWVYLTSTSLARALFTIGDSNTSSGLEVYRASATGLFVVYNNGAAQITSTNSFANNQWVYLALTRSGTTIKLYVNGTQEGSSWSSSTSFNGPLYIAAEYWNGGLNTYTLGYVSDFHWSSAADIGLSLPTSPATSNANTELLTCQYQGTVRNVGFIDSSPNNFPITRNGNTTQGSFSPFSADEGKWSNYFDGVSGQLEILSATNLDLGQGNFTIEGWINPVNTNVVFCSGGSAIGDRFDFCYVSSTGLRFFVSSSAGNVDIDFPDIAVNEWTHVAIVRDGNDVEVFYNGVSQGSTTTSGFSMSGIASRFLISQRGWLGSSQERMTGYISNVRITNAALYTSGFTPSTSPLTTTVNSGSVLLLTCQSNRYVDNSTNAFTVIVNGTHSVQPFSPFAPSAAYSTSVNGGSGYFDGSGDYLAVPYNSALTMPAGTDFCIEAWVYKTVDAGVWESIITTFPSATCGAWIFSIKPTNKLNLNVYPNATISAAESTTSITANQWFHVAATREGTTYRLFVNGVLESTVTATQSIGVASANILIGREQTDTSRDFSGYISNCRMVVGSAVYTSSFTPSGPLTAVTNTQLLTSFTNAGIYDSTAKNDLETVGNAQVDTSVVKYGTGSMKFDGTGDNLTAPTSVLNNFGTGDFTVECWVYANSFSSTPCIVDSRATGAGVPWAFYITSGGYPYFYDGTSRTSTIAVSTTTWTHIAASRSSGTLKIFVNGVEGYSAANTTSMAGAGLQIGGAWGGSYLNGYIDDLRITKGVARYTSAFTPPDKAFPNQ